MPPTDDPLKMLIGGPHFREAKPGEVIPGVVEYVFKPKGSPDPEQIKPEGSPAPPKKVEAPKEPEKDLPTYVVHPHDVPYPLPPKEKPAEKP